MTNQAGGGASEQSIKPGTSLSDGTVIQQYLGRSAGGVSYFGEMPDVGRVSVKVLSPKLAEAADVMGATFESLRSVDDVGVQKLLTVRLGEEPRYLVYEFSPGETLRAALDARASEGQAFTFRAVFNVLGHLTTALEALHAVAPHGVLTSENIYVRTGGAISITNAGYARAMLVAEGADSEGFRDSLYIAPEVRDDPWQATEASDFYSLGVIALSLLCGKHPTSQNLPALLRFVDDNYTERVRGLIDATMVKDPAVRIATMEGFRSELRAALRSVRNAGRSGDTQMGLAVVPTDAHGNIAPLTPAAEPKVVALDDDLFAGIILPDAPDAPESTGEERWIVSRGGRDYGPFTDAQIHEQLEADEIDENVDILDTYTQDIRPLIDVPAFTDFVIDYIPKREKRRIEEQERREEIVRQVKRKSQVSFAVIALGGLVVLAGVGYLIANVRAKPVEYPLDNIIRSFRFEFEVPEPEYQAIAADSDLMASLFNFDDPAPTRSRRSRRSSGSQGSGGGNDEPSADDYVVNFDSTQPAFKLTNDQVNDTLMSNLGRIQGCFSDEVRANPSFTGATVTWSIYPDGRTFNVRVDGHGRITDALSSCLTRGFRRIQFPEFNDIPMSVSFPFNIQ